jgi:Glycosyl transferase 4-like domain/Glycosyl transferases group 1
MLFGSAHGPDVRVRRVSQALAAAGYSVRILAWDRAELLPKVDRDGPVEVRRVHVASYHDRGWSQVFFLSRAVLRYIPHILRRPPDIIHAIDLPMLLAAILIAPLTGRRPRIVYDAFEIYAILESHKYPRWLLRVIELAEWVLPRFADLVITPGEGRRQYFARHGISSVVVPNWVDVPTREIDAAEARSALGIPSDAVTIVYAGGLDRSRDLISLVAHARRHPEHTVLVAGRGEQEASLRRQAERIPNLRILGWLPNPTSALAAADVLYYSLKADHPYAAHAAPNNLYVAVAHAIPLVHRAQGEIGLLAGQHDIGASFHDEASLDAAIERIAEPATNARIREELRGLQDRFLWSSARERLVEAYPRPRTAMSNESVNGE